MSDSQLWKVFADEKRRKMLVFLSENDRTPSEIAEHFNMSPSLISNNLRLMKLSDLVHERREGQRVIYSINKEKGINMADYLGSMFQYSLDALEEYSTNKEKNKKKK